MKDFVSIFALGLSLCFGAGSTGPARTEDVLPEEALKAIYLEVKELGPYPGETFIKHDFFLGPADDDSYKKEHIVILIQVVDGEERLLVQVTEMKNRPDEPRVQLAGRTRAISCSVRASGRLTVLRSDYGDKDIRRLAADILRAVREKKKLLREYAPPPAGR